MKKNEESAFPHITADGSYCSGMTLRDYFAAKAMQTLMDRYNRGLTDSEISYQAYKIADAMLTQRSNS